VTALNRERSRAQFRFPTRFALRLFQVLIRVSNLLDGLVANKTQSESQASFVTIFATAYGEWLSGNHLK
jgi:hypothetical protein